MLREKKNFAFETVLSTERNLNLLKKAKEQGYFIKCFYILTADPIINVARVKLRVLTGGHDVPEEKIVTRYDRALKLIPEFESPMGHHRNPRNINDYGGSFLVR